MKTKWVICSGTKECNCACHHGVAHQKELELEGNEIERWCTEWDECEKVTKKVRCTKVKEAP